MNSIIHQNDRSILGPSDATDRPPAVLAAAERTWGDVATAEVHVVGGETIVPRGRPIVPVGITVVNRRTIHIPGIDEIVRIGS